MIPKKLYGGGHVRIIAPANSVLPKLTSDIIERGITRLNSLGLEVSFGKHIREVNDFKTASVRSRLTDLHEAFLDSSVDAVLALSGGTTSNQLLSHIDYRIIKENPKFICGLSDVTALLNAIYVKTGVVTYYGPHFTAIAASTDATYTLTYFRKCLMEDHSITLTPSDIFYNTPWTDTENINSGYWIINEGEAEGTVVGGNLLTFNFLQDTDYILNADDPHPADLHSGGQCCRGCQ